MAVEFNAQFKQFVHFAEQQMQAGKSTAKAQVGDVAKGGPLAGRTIVAKKGDFVGNVGRGVDSRNINNDARTLFKQALVDMFHGESNIPTSVLDAMKLADFGKGKPLTARRILAVKTAVEQSAGSAGRTADAAAGIDEKIQAGIENCTSKIGKNRRDLARPLIKVAFEACNRDPDAVDIVLKNVSSRLLYTATADFRSEEQIRKMVGDMVSNLEELRSVAKGDPAIFAAGKDMLVNHGKTFPPGAIAKMVEAAGQIPIDDVRNLSASSPAKSIHTAVTGLVKSLNDAMASWGADKHLDGAEEMAPARSFLTGVLLSRCDQITLRNVHNALNSNTGKQLLRFYQECCSADNRHVEGQSEDIRNGVSDVAVDCHVSLRMLNDEANANIGRMNPSEKPSPLPSYIDDELNLKAIGGKDIVKAIIASAKESNARKVENQVNATVTGSGQGADIMKGILRAKLDGANKPEQKLGKSISANANAMINWTICGEMKKLAGGDFGQFEKDVNRMDTVVLKNGDMEFRLAKKMDVAMDQLAQFITGDKTAKYDDRLRPSDRNKIHFMMAVINQETEKAGEMGGAFGLDTRESDQAFTVGTDRRPGAPEYKRTFSFETTEDGGISMHYTMDKPISTVQGDDDHIDVGLGSTFQFELDYSMKGSEFNHIAELDYSKFDDKGATKIFSQKIEMPDGSKKEREERLMKVVDSFPEEFRINADCTMNFTMKLLPTDEEQIIQNAPLQGGNVVFRP